MGARAIEVGRSGSAEEVRLRAAALSDLDADFDELQFLCRSAEAELAQAVAELDAASLPARTGELLGRQLASARRRYRSVGERLVVLRQLAQSERPTPSMVSELAAQKASLADLLRAERALTAGLVAAADWQSPSFLHSTMPAAGRQRGRIQAHWNDYKRDRHLDGEELERRWVAEMVDGPPGLRALLTTCGMAALTTVLSFLTMEGQLGGPVLVGAGVYHETRLLLERAMPGRVRIVDERDTQGLLRTIEELNPSAIFLDALSNTKWMPVAELPPLIDHLRHSETHLVIDNTGLSVFSQPFALADESVRLIVFESLLKYAQLGLDRANAGVIVARGEVAEALSEYREHLGTNVADVAVHAVPSPDRGVLERRLERLGRNALVLASHLRDRVDGAVEIVYPGLACPASVAAASGRVFSGGCLSIVFDAARSGLAPRAPPRRTGGGGGGRAGSRAAGRLELWLQHEPDLSHGGARRVRRALRSRGRGHRTQRRSREPRGRPCGRGPRDTGRPGEGSGFVPARAEPPGSSPYVQRNRREGAETWLKPRRRSLPVGASGASRI